MNFRAGIRLFNSQFLELIKLRALPVCDRLHEIQDEFLDLGLQVEVDHLRYQRVCVHYTKDVINNRWGTYQSGSASS